MNSLIVSVLAEKFPTGPREVEEVVLAFFELSGVLRISNGLARESLVNDRRRFFENGGAYQLTFDGESLRLISENEAMTLEQRIPPFPAHYEAAKSEP